MVKHDTPATQRLLTHRYHTIEKWLTCQWGKRRLDHRRKPEETGGDRRPCHDRLGLWKWTLETLAIWMGKMINLGDLLRKMADQPWRKPWDWRGKLNDKLTINWKTRGFKGVAYFQTIPWTHGPMSSGITQQHKRRSIDQLLDKRWMVMIHQPSPCQWKKEWPPLLNMFICDHLRREIVY